jgi:hypothetical protein
MNAPNLRQIQLAEARELVRRAQIWTARELLQQLQCIHSNLRDEDNTVYHIAPRLLELMTDLDADINAMEPELSSIKAPWQYDAFTPNVRNA